MGTGEAQGREGPGKAGLPVTHLLSIPPPATTTSTHSTWDRIPAAAWLAWWTPAWVCG